MTENTSTEVLDKIEKLLSDDWERERRNSNRSLIIGLIVCVIILGYLSWISSRLSDILDPVQASEAAVGAALDAIPKAGEDLRNTLVDMAPELATLVMEQVLGAVPAYRKQLFDRIGKSIDEAARMVAQGSATALSESIEKDRQFDREEVRIVVDELVARYTKSLDEILDEPDEEGTTLRKRLNETLEDLTSIDRQLKVLARTKRPATEGARMERDFIMAWMKLLLRYEEVKATAEKEEYRERRGEKN